MIMQWKIKILCKGKVCEGCQRESIIYSGYAKIHGSTSKWVNCSKTGRTGATLTRRVYYRLTYYSIWNFILCTLSKYKKFAKFYFREFPVIWYISEILAGILGKSLKSSDYGNSLTRKICKSSIFSILCFCYGLRTGVLLLVPSCLWFLMYNNADVKSCWLIYLFIKIMYQKLHNLILFSH